MGETLAPPRFVIAFYCEVFIGERMLDLHLYFSHMLASKCGHVTGFHRLNVKDILYILG